MPTPLTIAPLVEQSILKVTAAPEAKTPPKAGIKRVALGGVKKAESAKPAAKTYPELPDTDDHSPSMLAADIRSEQEQYEALEGSLKQKKPELRALAAPFYFQACSGMAEIPSSVRVPILRMHSVPDCAEDDPRALEQDGAVLVTFANKYSGVDEEKIRELLQCEAAEDATDFVSQYFRQSFTLKIDGDKLPMDVAADVIAALQAVMAQHGCAEAMTAAEKIVPTSEFHTARHRLLSVAQNRLLDQAMPCQASVKVKGVK